MGASQRPGEKNYNTNVSRKGCLEVGILAHGYGIAYCKALIRR